MREKMIDDIIDLNDIPVQALSTGTISKLDCMLDKEKILLSRPGGLPRDYRGIAELLNVSIIDGWLGEKAMMKLIREFGPKNQLTLGKLQTYFEKIDRYDVLDDTSNMFDEDAREYVKKMNSLVPIQANHHFRNIERDMLTEDDIVRIPSGNGPQTYNAFILYVDEDRHFAEELISKMENEYGLKICDRDRDLIPGLTFEDSAIQRLIAERCDRLIVILSNEFVRSDRHTFLFKYAQAISCDQGRRKVIPCIYKKCELPLEYRIFMFLDYERYNGGILGDFWSKLNNSLLPIENSAPTLVKNDEPEGVKIEDITAKDAKTEDLRSNKVENEKKMQFSNQNVNLKSDVSNKENEFVLKNDKTVFLNKRNLSFGTKINNFFIKIKKPRNTDTAHIVEEKKAIGLSSGNVEYEEKNQFSNASLKSDVSTKEHDSLLKDEKVVISNKKNLSFGKIKNNILIKIKKPRRKEAVCAL